MKALFLLLPLFGGCFCALSLIAIPTNPAVNNIIPVADIVANPTTPAVNNIIPVADIVAITTTPAVNNIIPVADIVAIPTTPAVNNIVPVADIVAITTTPAVNNIVPVADIVAIPTIPAVNNIVSVAGIVSSTQPAAIPTSNDTYCFQTHNTSQINFYFWKRSPEGKESYEITYGNQSQVKPIYSRYGDIPVIVFFHDIGGNGTQDWIINSTNHFMGPAVPDTNSMAIISINHAKFVLSKPEAVKNIDLIANHSAVFLKWVFNNIAPPPKNLLIKYIGHGIGALIASRTIQIMKKLYNDTRKPFILTVLDFEILSEEDLMQVPSCHQRPGINKSDAESVIVIHTSTCFISPPIPACSNDTNTTIGKGDFYPNGGAEQPGCSASDLACKRKRAAELFYDELITGSNYQNAMIAWRCPSFKAFQQGKCDSCQTGCAFMSGVHPLWTSGRFYLYTNAQPKFGRGYSMKQRLKELVEEILRGLKWVLSKINIFSPF